jgi:uncharacterized repeat protein (TIGR03837 family)
MRWDLFCRVIDNHGDLGVCWRLAADLAARGEAVRLWVDRPEALHWMAPGALEGRRGVQVLPWREPRPEESPGHVVVEAFGCEPPDAFVARMAAARQEARAPCWINLEYLSAEAYVERSHGLPSPLQSGPGAGLTRWFYYPGFTPRTGGLLREGGLLAARDQVQAASPSPWPGATARAQVTVFTYADAPLAAWLAGLDGTPADLWIAPGHPSRLAAALLGRSEAAAGDVAAVGSATLHVLPHVDQASFDRRLWLADLNLVRGEDSLVRALWAGRPFVWQPYRQADGAHAAKLDAFLDRYLCDAPADAAQAIRSAHRDWNAAAGLSAPATAAAPGLATAAASLFRAGSLPGPAWRAFAAWRTRQWAAELPDLTAGLIHFAAARQ